jgi:hypothetical protein
VGAEDEDAGDCSVGVLVERVHDGALDRPVPDPVAAEAGSDVADEHLLIGLH